MPKLKLVKSHGLDDWYTIERAEHDNKTSFSTKSIGGVPCMVLVYSGRISDADVEGPSSEMLEIAKAIKKRGRIEFRRCAVCVSNSQIEPHWRAKFWSPRNSTRMGEVTLAEADELAEQIRAELGPTPRPASFPIGAKVLVDGQVAARVTGHFPEGSSSYLFPHYKLDIEDGDRNVAVSVARVGADRLEEMGLKADVPAREVEYHLEQIDAWRSGRCASPERSADGERYALEMRREIARHEDELIKLGHQPTIEYRARHGRG